MPSSSAPNLAPERPQDVNIGKVASIRPIVAPGATSATKRGDTAAGLRREPRSLAAAMGSVLAPHVTGQPSHVCPVCERVVEHRRAELLGTVVYRPTRCQCEKDLDDLEEQELENRQRAIRTQRRLSESGLREREITMRFSTFEKDRQPAAYATVRDYANLAQGWDVLILAGTFGTGKTHLAAAAVRTLCLLDKSAAFVDVPALRREITATFNRGDPASANKSEASIIRRYSSMQFLALDDWGAEGKQSDWFDGVLFGLINERYVSQLPMLITTNMGKEEFSRWVGGRLASRLSEGSRWVTLESRDYRSRKKVQD